MKRMLFTIVVMVGCMMSVAVGQAFVATVQNQNVQGTDFFFDIYVERMGTTQFFLGTSDFVFTFNRNNFTTPATEVVQPGTPGGRIETFYSAGSEISTDRVIVNLMAPFLTSQSQFNTRIQEVPVGSPGILVATVKISGISSPTQSSGLTWRSESPNNTVVFSMASASLWLMTDVTASGTFIPPDDVPLPVTMGAMSAIAQQGAVELTWQTTTEVNTAKFEIERRDGVEWMKRGEVNAAGTSNVPIQYRYADNIGGATSDRLVYRLKIVDKDGSFKYSASMEIVAVPMEFELSQNYPNPFNPTTTIRYALPSAATVTMQVFDVIGRMVMEETKENQQLGYHEMQFGGERLTTGIYFYQLTASVDGKVLYKSVKRMSLLK